MRHRGGRFASDGDALSACETDGAAGYAERIAEATEDA